jgi:ABC-type polysaccharide/polyol phosphate export permease
MAAIGLIKSAWAVLLLPAALLTGLAFATPTMAWVIMLKHETSLNYPIRFGAIPLMLFSGTFFPVTQLPGWIRPVAYATPLWHGVALCRALSLGDLDAGSVALHVGYLAGLAAVGLWLAAAPTEGASMSRSSACQPLPWMCVYCRYGDTKRTSTRRTSLITATSAKRPTPDLRVR